MKGWKTWTGAVIVAGGAALEFFGFSDIAKLLYGVGGALGLIGIGHKIDKTRQEY